MAKKQQQKLLIAKKPKKAKRQREKALTNEIGFIGKALRGLGGLGGSTLGSMLGHPAAGGQLGTSLGAALSKWMGTGDYSVQKNSVLRAASSIPSMHKNDQTVTIRHKEFLGALRGSVGFQVQREFTLNPGLTATFPWLSDIARSFQEYEIKGMVFHYIPTSGSAVSSTSSALGSVMIQTSYRSTEVAPASKIEMLNEYWSNEVVPFETMAHPIECDPKENPFSVHYVRSGAISSGEPLLYDVGKTFVATQGMQSEYTIGDLWVTYEIELKKPMVSSDVTKYNARFNATYINVTTSNFFGTLSVSSGSLPIQTGVRSFVIPVGYYGVFEVLVHIRSDGGLASASGVAFAGAPTLTNCVATNQVDGGSTYLTTTTVGGNTTDVKDLYYHMTIYKAEPHLSAAIDLPIATWVSGATSYLALTVTELGPLT